MKNAKTHISILLDRTGSMESIRDDVIGGFNTFLKNQKKEKEKASLTLVQFDTQDPYEIIHWLKPVKDIPELNKKTYEPRAATPLLDAMGRGINDLEKCISKMKKSERPEKLVMVVITDGQENSSVEFKKGQIVKMIKQKQKKDDWQFVFLSADLDSIDDAGEYGFHNASTMAFDKDAKGIAGAFDSLSYQVSEYRTDKAMAVQFDDKDRSKQKSEKQRKKS